MKKFLSVFLSLVISSLFVVYPFSVSAVDRLSVTYCKHLCSWANSSQSVDYNLSIDYLTQAATREVYGVSDTRIRDYDSAVVRLTSPAKDANGNLIDGYITVGTGFIVGKNMIATAAHCVYDGSFVEQMTISIFDSNDKLVKSLSPYAYHIPKLFKTSGNSNYDYALIEVNFDLSPYGMYEFGAITSEYMQNYLRNYVYVSGFPAGDINGESTRLMRYFDKGLMHSVADNRIEYTTDTSGGQSGGPVFLIVKNLDGVEQRVVIGIHTTGFQREGDEVVVDSYNSGIRITSRELNFFNNNNYKYIQS